jgi:bifunctional enzyme CysN/CysC
LIDSTPDPDPSAGLAEYLRNQEDKSLLRFLTCGSVEDGKPTLIGRLLYDTRLIAEDQLAGSRAGQRQAWDNGRGFGLCSPGRWA